MGMPHLPYNEGGIPGKLACYPPLNTADDLQDEAPNTQEGAITQQERVNGSSNALSLRAKYGLSDESPRDCASSVQGHVRDLVETTGFLANLSETKLGAKDEKMKGSGFKEAFRAERPCLASDIHLAHDEEDDRQVEHSTDNESMSCHKVTSAKHHAKGTETIMVTTLQAARANAAELRALHSAVVNRNITPGTDIRKSTEQRWHPMSVGTRVGHPRSRVNKGSDIYEGRQHTFVGVETKEDANSRQSSISSASSTADCFIRPVHDYPVFMPHSREDMLLTTTMDDMDSSTRCSSVDLCESAMQKERIQYIFDHNNKKNFSHSYLDHPYLRKNRIACLHESLNLPPKSVANLMQAQEHDNYRLQHMSLNLPQGSQQHLFQASMQNPLFDTQEPRHNEQHFLHRPSHNLYDGSGYSPSLMKYSMDTEGKAMKNKPPDFKYAHPQEAALRDLTSRQRALIEFLSEEPARMMAFNELAAKQTAPGSEVHLSASTPLNVEDNTVSSNPVKDSDNFGTSVWNTVQNQGRDDHAHHSHQNANNIGIATDQNLPHISNSDHVHQPSTLITCDKCRPASGDKVRGRDSTEIHTSSPSTSVGDHQEQSKKHSSIKTWLFGSRKKQHSSVDHLPNSAAAGRSHRPAITSAGKHLPPKEQVGTAATNMAPISAAASRVFSSLATSETEKTLELAMAMDLMELKILQANTKRDAAMAEVLELRLAIDAMAKKLVEVERHCQSLHTQLLERTHLAPMTQKGDVPEGLWAHPHPAAGDEIAPIAATDQQRGGARGASVGGEDDFCESDSHENLEERKAATCSVRSGLGVPPRPGYGGGRRVAQPKKEEFLSAVAEARVGVKQVSRAMLQHVQERMVKGAGVEMAEDEAELWRPVVTMCREARKAGEEERRAGGGGKERELGFCIEALISMAFHEHFENVGFTKSGAHPILDPTQRATAFHLTFLKLSQIAPTQLLAQTSPLYQPLFDRFCSRKMKTLGRAVGCPGRLWPDELARTFLSAARAVWLLHHLAFAYADSAPAIFRVAAESSLDTRFMELLPSHHNQPHQRLVSLTVMPGFFLCDDVIKCKVLAY